jgi:hypothetical protein
MKLIEPVLENMIIPVRSDAGDRVRLEFFVAKVCLTAEPGPGSRFNSCSVLSFLAVRMGVVARKRKR